MGKNKMKDRILITVIILLILAVGASGHYAKKAILYERLLNGDGLELKIEKDEPKLKDNMTRILDLEGKLSYNKNKMTDLLRENKRLKSEKKIQIREGIKNVKTTKDICDKFAELGYPICRPYTNSGGRK